MEVKIVCNQTELKLTVDLIDKKLKKKLYFIFSSCFLDRNR